MKRNLRVEIGHLAYFIVMGLVSLGVASCSGNATENGDGKILSVDTVNVESDTLNAERSKLETYLESLEQVQLSEDSVLTVELGTALVYTGDVWPSTGTLFDIEYDAEAFDRKVLGNFSNSKPDMEGSDSGSQSWYLISKKAGEYMVRVKCQRHGNEEDAMTYRVVVKRL